MSEKNKCLLSSATEFQMIFCSITVEIADWYLLSFNNSLSSKEIAFLSTVSSHQSTCSICIWFTVNDCIYFKMREFVTGWIFDKWLCTTWLYYELMTFNTSTFLHFFLVFWDWITCWNLYQKRREERNELKLISSEDSDEDWDSCLSMVMRFLYIPISWYYRTFPVGL